MYIHYMYVCRHLCLAFFGSRLPAIQGSGGLGLGFRELVFRKN